MPAQARATSSAHPTGTAAPVRRRLLAGSLEVPVSASKWFPDSITRFPILLRNVRNIVIGMS